MVVFLNNQQSMKILIASDAFKGGASAEAVCEAMARGLRRSHEMWAPVPFPLGDGGEGTAAVLTQHSGGRIIHLTVNGPLFRKTEAGYGLSGDGKTAYIEMAAASGLPLLPEAARNPLETTTFGTGELLLHALQQGVERVVLCIGGSATNDAGMGMAAALGYRFLDERGELLPAKGSSLEQVAQIDRSRLKADWSGVEFLTLCDVNNPLYGPEGAAYVYAGQKGADEAAIARLDKGLQHLAPLLSNLCGQEVAELPGAGAAGGLGAGSVAFLGASLEPGVETVMALTGFDAALQGCSLVLTGEGQLDGQTRRGKLIQGIARRAGERGIPVVALCGALLADADALKEVGLQAAFCIQNRPVGLEQALLETEERLEASAEQLGRLMMAWLGNVKM